MPDVHEQFSEAVDLAELGRYDEALALFRVLLKTDSNNATIWNDMGIIQFRQGDYRDAVNAFGPAADIDPSHWIRAMVLLSVMVQLHQPAERVIDPYGYSWGMLLHNPHDLIISGQEDCPGFSCTCDVDGIHSHDSIIFHLFCRS